MQPELEILHEFKPGQPVVLIDFDHTLIDTAKVTAWLRERIHDLGFSQADIDRTYEEAKNADGAYDLDKHVQLLCDCGAKSAAETAVAIYSACPVQQAIFPDAHIFLEQNAGKANLVLFTLGAKSVQMSKLNCAHIKQHLTAVIITIRNKAQVLNEIVEIYPMGIRIRLLDNSLVPQIIVIDDHPREFMNLLPELRGRLELYRVRRPGEKYSELDTPEFVHEVQDFSHIRI